MNKVWYVKKFYNLTTEEIVESNLNLDDDVQIYSINFKKIDLKNYKPKNCWIILDFGDSKKYVSLEKNNE